MIPEIDPAVRKQVIRIPRELDVPVTDRVVALLDSRPMQRLRGIAQLGLVAQVYPGARHSRLEHSLGVYRLACLALDHLLQADQQLATSMSEQETSLFLVSCLLHDVGHWPYCHPIEDLKLPGLVEHEQLAAQLICNPPLATVLEREWDLDPSDVAGFLQGHCPTDNLTVLHHLLNGPVDIDKIDYLQRDSHHAGVPYGSNFDVNRLLNSLCVDEHRRSIAISDKGKTAAEMMVFARYVMFSEVYWHHTVRAATAMLQRAVYCLHQSETHIDQIQPAWLEAADAEFERWLQSRLPDQAAHLGTGLFSGRRLIYKRLAQYGFLEHPEIHRLLGGRAYPQLVECGRLLAQALSRGLARPLEMHDILIDAPPVELEVQFRIQVREGSPDGHRFRGLAEMSPVVSTLATHQFDNFVKRVRIFIHPDRAADVQPDPHRLTEIVLAAARQAANGD